MTFLRWLLGAVVAVLALLAAVPLAIALAMNPLNDPGRWLSTLLLVGATGLYGGAAWRLFRGGAALPWFAGAAGVAFLLQIIHSNGAMVGLAQTPELLIGEAAIVAFYLALGALIWLTERRKAPPSVALRDGGV